MAEWVKIAAICATVVAIVIFFVALHNSPESFTLSSPNAHVQLMNLLNMNPAKSRGEDSKTAFTTDELNYVLYGEGNLTVSPRDPRYLGYLRSLIAAPSPHRPSSAIDSRINNFAMLIDNRLRHKERGFFIECGAADGDSGSNTMFLERKRGWTGLLVEANKRYFKQILKKNRKAYVFGGCLSTYKHPAMLAFKAASDQGGLQDHLGALDNDIKAYHSFESLDYVYCVPLNDLLAALDVKHVDYFSLDVQGAELPILETIDFKSVQIDIIIAEAANSENAAALRKFFNKTGIYKEKDSQSSMDIMMEHINLK